MLLNREAFLSVPVALPTEDVPWGDSVIRVRGLTALERDQFEQLMFDNSQRREKARSKPGARVPEAVPFRLALLVRAIVGEDGARLFRDDEYRLVGERLPADVANRAFEAARRLSGMTEEDAEELEGNSAEAPADDSHSD